MACAAVIQMICTCLAQLLLQGVQDGSLLLSCCLFKTLHVYSTSGGKNLSLCNGCTWSALLLKRKGYRSEVGRQPEISTCCRPHRRSTLDL